MVKWALALFFTVAGANHFFAPEWYLKIMPPFLPWHRPLVYLSGALEMALGLALLSPRLERKAGWGLAALLLGVFPANVHMALHPEAFPAFKPLTLWLRLPLQFVLIGLVFWSARAPRKAD
ncbi:MAG: DoxX family protein [Fibrobacterota bacterium]|nr:DoxX family protein [Fibrobacterota bacterium]